jgi:hypothetical protein
VGALLASSCAPWSDYSMNGERARCEGVRREQENENGSRYARCAYRLGHYPYCRPPESATKDESLGRCDSKFQKELSQQWVSGKL